MKKLRGRVTAVVVCLAAFLLSPSCVLWSHKYTRRDSHHTAAIAGLRAYLGAQGTFQRVDRYGNGKLVYANPIDGKGFPDLYRLGGPLGKESVDGLRLIDFAFARAISPETAKCGYWFVDIVADAKTGPYNFAKEFGLCAVPAVYGKSGIYTYIIDFTGTVYKKDNGGRPVQAYPDTTNEGWDPVGS
jgi:hypothetical protein